jgi:mycothiol system anti-sigma-R factor
MNPEDPVNQYESHAADSDEGKPECQEALDTLYHFLDGELTEHRRTEIQQHLAQCSPCLEAFDFEAELKMVIAKRCRDQVPEGLRFRVAAALAEASGIPQQTASPTLLSESQDK